MSELEQIYHSSRLHKTLKEAGKEIKKMLQVTEKKEAGSELPPHRVALDRVRLFLSATSASPSIKTATHPDVQHPAHLPAPGTTPAMATRPLHCSRCPCPTGNDMGRLQEDHSYCSMPLCRSPGWKGHTGHAHPPAMFREQEDFGCPWLFQQFGKCGRCWGRFLASTMCTLTPQTPTRNTNLHRIRATLHYVVSAVFIQLSRIRVVWKNPTLTALPVVFWERELLVWKSLHTKTHFTNSWVNNVYIPNINLLIV